MSASLSATLASRGARDPAALAAFITRQRGISLASSDLTCPSCGHSGPSSEFSGDDDDDDSASGDTLRTPAPSTGSVRDGVPLTVRGGAAHALANGTRRSVQLAAAALAPRRPIHGPMDVLVARQEDGTALLRHRHGGAQIAAIRKTADGKWLATVNGRDLIPREHQRTALMEAVGTWNTAVRGAQAAGLRPQPEQTPLMAEYGIRAERSAAFATPDNGAADGPNATSSDGGSTDGNGLTAKGQAIYKKLIAKGFPPARAIAFAKNSQNAKPGQFTKSS